MSLCCHNRRLADDSHCLIYALIDQHGPRLQHPCRALEQNPVTGTADSKCSQRNICTLLTTAHMKAGMQSSKTGLQAKRAAEGYPHPCNLFKGISLPAHRSSVCHATMHAHSQTSPDIYATLRGKIDANVSEVAQRHRVGWLTNHCRVDPFSSACHTRSRLDRPQFCAEQS